MKLSSFVKNRTGRRKYTIKIILLYNNMTTRRTAADDGE